MATSSKILIDKINNVTNASTITVTDLARINSSFEVTQTIYSVKTIADLPNPVSNKGRMIFVESLNKYLYSNGIEWTDDIKSPSLTLWTWGYNISGQLGDNSTTSRSSPGIVSGGEIGWEMVSGEGGENHTSGIKTDGTLWTWGANGFGQLGDNSTTSRSSPGTVSGGGNNWKMVSNGRYNISAIKTDGTLWTWGSNGSGVLGDDLNVNVSRSSPNTTAGGGTNWSIVSGGFNHTAAIKTNGELWCWGYNFYGQLGDGTTTNRSSPVMIAGGGTNWLTVSCGRFHTGAIKTDGTLRMCGYNLTGQLGDGTTTSSAYGIPPAGGSGTDWSMVSCGYGHTAALKTNGSLWTWGQNDYAQLGSGNLTYRSSPVTVAGGGTNWSMVNCGWYHTAGIKTDGTLWTWGRNGFGGLGDGTTTNRSSPVTVAGSSKKWVTVRCGWLHTAAISL